MITNYSADSSTSWFKRACKIAGPLPEGRANGNESSNAFAVFSHTDDLWTDTQNIKYWFLDGADTQRQKVRQVIDEWTWYANIQFTEASAAIESNIRIQFDPDDGSWSYVGLQCESVAGATMNLAWVEESSQLTSNERGVILHGFGHVLGLLHEHQSPAHGGAAVRNVPAAISLYSRTQGWSIQQIYDQVIKVYAVSDVSNFSQVDTRSIMHYPQPKELTGLAEDIPFNERLSDLDKAYVILQYPRREVHPRAAMEGWSFEKALSVMGAPSDVTDQVLHLLKSDIDDSTGEISPVNIRNVIEQWTRAAHSNSGNSTSDLTR